MPGGLESGRCGSRQALSRLSSEVVARADLVISLWTSSDYNENDDRFPAKEVQLFLDEKLAQPRNLFS